MTPPTDRTAILAHLRRPTPTPSAVEFRRGDGPALLLPSDAVDRCTDLMRGEAAVLLALAASGIGDSAGRAAYVAAANWLLALADWFDRLPGAGDRVVQTWQAVPTGRWSAEAPIDVAPAPGEAVA